MDQINWGIIGCGNVTELKSGPAFNKVDGSRVVAVMRRDAPKARDYAQRHGIPAWYNDSGELINDPEVNAVYIATPPSSHAEYAIRALEKGKVAYVEKPMAVSYSDCVRMQEFTRHTGIPLYVAYYRRFLPYFIQVKKILDEGQLGDLLFAKIDFHIPPGRRIILPKHFPGAYCLRLPVPVIFMTWPVISWICSTGSSERSGRFRALHTTGGVYTRQRTWCMPTWCMNQDCLFLAAGVLQPIMVRIPISSVYSEPVQHLSFQLLVLPLFRSRAASVPPSIFRQILRISSSGLLRIWSKSFRVQEPRHPTARRVSAPTGSWIKFWVGSDHENHS